MPFLFSYGTLQHEDVQRATFGRTLRGQRDELPGFEPSLVPIEDPEVAARLGHAHHANITPTGGDDGRVHGTVFEVTAAELAAADAFEAAFSYERMTVILASGQRAEVYVHADRAADKEQR